MAKRKEYTIITFVGKINVGKSSFLNLLSGQKDFAIVDAQPGTTTDTVIARMEIHGLGPIKVMDTAGIDEYSELGAKKRKKTYQAIEESDLTILIIDLLNNKNFTIEQEIIQRANKYHNQILIVYNIFQKGFNSKKLEKLQKIADKKLAVDLPSICINALDTKKQSELSKFIGKHFAKESRDIELIPLDCDKGYVLLNIPMDEETPTLRLLRPQDMAMERLLRKYLTPVLYRMNLKKARANDKEEKKRFLATIKHLQDSPVGLKLIITDSQAMDILGDWAPTEIPLTTFSVMMANYMSGGNLPLFVKGLKIFPNLKNNDKILIMESCNHDRKCDDIGTNQIPRLIKEKLKLDLQIDFSFGRVLPENLEQYKLVIHCGGCMIERQRYIHRMKKLREMKIPITNYGLFLSWIHNINNPKIINRVTKIFNK